MKLKPFFISFKELLMKQITQFFLEGGSPTLMSTIGLMEHSNQVQ